MGLGESPILKISGIPLDCPSFSWSMLAGANPNKEKFQVSSVVSDKIGKLKNPVSLLFDFPIGRGAKIENHKVEFKNLYLTERKVMYGYQDEWELSDSRLFWDGRKIARMYNITWGGYSQLALQPKLELQFLNFTRVQGVRYAPWSLKKEKKNEFFVPNSFGTRGAEPWTVKAILLDILINSIGIDPKNIVDNLPDNKFQPENLIYDMQDAPTSIQSILQQAHGSLYQQPDGKIKLFGLAGKDAIIDDILGRDFKYLHGSELPFTQDLSRIRPGKIRVGFEKQYEIIFKYEEQGVVPGGGTVRANGAPTRTFDLENVLQLPDTIKFGRDTYVAGSWMPVFQALNLWNADPTNPPPSGSALTKSLILRRWCVENYLEFMYGTYILGKGISRVDEIWANRIGAFRSHFRKTFRVVPFWAERIRQFIGERAALLDPITGRKTPSPVWVDYTKIATYRHLIKSKNPSAHVAAHVIKSYPANGKFATSKPATAYIDMLDQKLGIFTADFLPDPNFFTMKYIMGEVDPVPKVAAGLSQDLTLWGNVSLKPDFKLATILSCIFAVPNNRRNKVFYDFDIKKGNKDRVVELYSTQDNARFEAGDKMTASFEKDGDVKIDGVKLTNENIIKAIAGGEAKQFDFSWQDRNHIGSFTSPGYKAGWEPIGWIRSVSVHFNPELGMSTIISMPDPPAAKPLLTFMGPKVRHILQKSVLSREGF